MDPYFLLQRDCIYNDFFCNPELIGKIVVIDIINRFPFFCQNIGCQRKFFIDKLLSIC